MQQRCQGGRRAPVAGPVRQPALQVL